MIGGQIKVCLLQYIRLDIWQYVLWHAYLMYVGVSGQTYGLLIVHGEIMTGYRLATPSQGWALMDPCWHSISNTHKSAVPGELLLAISYFIASYHGLWNTSKLWTWRPYPRPFLLLMLTEDLHQNLSGSLTNRQGLGRGWGLGGGGIWGRDSKSAGWVEINAWVAVLFEPNLGWYSYIRFQSSLDCFRYISPLMPRCHERFSENKW